MKTKSKTLVEGFVSVIVSARFIFSLRFFSTVFFCFLFLIFLINFDPNGKLWLLECFQWLAMSTQTHMRTAYNFLLSVICRLIANNIKLYILPIVYFTSIFLASFIDGWIYNTSAFGLCLVTYIDLRVDYRLTTTQTMTTCPPRFPPSSTSPFGRNSAAAFDEKSQHTFRCCLPACE